MSNQQPRAPFRRIVTGHDEHGRAVILEDAPPPRVVRIGGEHGPLFFEVWNTRETPARIDRASGEPPEEGIQLSPPENGTRIRVLEVPPEDPSIARLTPDEARAHFAEVGAADAASHRGSGSKHAFMHRTETIDYGIVLEGEITLIVDEGETVARAGDIVIQRGTNHGWANRGKVPCRIAFILIDGRFDTELA
jgi:mannose-6-phosphate isomerase-like protein (cupin superfamily)